MATISDERLIYGVMIEAHGVGGETLDLDEVQLVPNTMLVRKLPPDQQSKGGIVFPKQAMHPPDFGVVVKSKAGHEAIVPERGSIVMISAAGGKPLPVGDDEVGEFLICEMDPAGGPDSGDILAWWNPESGTAKTLRTKLAEPDDEKKLDKPGADVVV